jgi:hypothetical protein
VLKNSLAVILILVLSLGIARADDSIHLVLYSREHLEIGQPNRASSQLEARAQLYLDAQSARIHILDETHIRIEFVVPVHISLHDPQTHQQQSEMVFKSFVLRIPKAELNRLIALSTQPFFVFGESNDQLILEMIHEISEGRNLDEQIKHLSTSFLVPQLRHLEGFRVVVPIEEIGLHEGGLGRIHVIGRLRGHLPWFHSTPAAIPLELPLSRVTNTYAQDDEIIRSYLNGLSLMDSRWHELKQLGWLGTLMQEPQKTTSLRGAQTNNLATLFKNMRCTQLFQK